MAWPSNNKSELVTVLTNTTQTIRFSSAVDTINWKCDGMTADLTSSLSKKSTDWSILLTQEKKAGLLDACKAQTGRLKWNIWENATYETSVPFTSHADGYACMKIPVLLRTTKGALLALAA